MGSIEVNGIRYDDETEIKDQVVGFYSSLYSETEHWRLDVDFLPFATIGEEAQRVMECRFDKDEILQVLKICEVIILMDILWLSCSIVGGWSKMIFWVSSMRCMNMVRLRNP